jgi:hypothetical protein
MSIDPRLHIQDGDIDGKQPVDSARLRSYIRDRMA